MRSQIEGDWGAGGLAESTLFFMKIEPERGMNGCNFE
jgi:hypothetical protein